MPPRTGTAVPMPRNLRPRATASQQHPGIVDAPRSRRTTEEVQAEKAEKDSAKALKEKNRKDTILETATFEQNAQKDLVNKMANASHPPTNTMKKVMRPKVGESAQSTIQSAEDEPAVEDAANEADVEILDASDEDEASKKKSKSKQKGKGGLRAEINSALGKTDPADGAAKRKASVSAADRATDSKKSKLRKAGLHPDWHVRATDPQSDEDVEMVDIATATTNRSYRARSASSEGVTDATGSAPGRSPGISEDEDALGGLSDNDGDGQEGQALSNTPITQGGQTAYYGGGANVTRTNVRSLAKIVPTSSVSTFVPPSKSAQIVLKKKKADIRQGDLPAEYQTRFYQKFVPQVLEALGAHTAWERLSNGELKVLWSATFPGVALDVESRDGLGLVVTKLLEDQISTWRNRFATSALRALDVIVFKSLPNQTTQTRSVWCTWAIGDDKSGWKRQPFYYESYEEDDDGKVKAKGIFQSAIIAAVLATHLSSIAQLNPNDRSDKKPIGALAYTLHAVKRAIDAWTSGEKDTNIGDFSKTIWGDHYVQEDGKSKLVAHTSEVHAVLQKLNEAQWLKILDAAKNAPSLGRTKKDIGSEYGPAAVDTDFDIQDDDSDLEKSQ